MQLSQCPVEVLIIVALLPKLLDKLNLRARGVQYHILKALACLCATIIRLAVYGDDAAALKARLYVA